jgi:undecaprenyl-diphosphatase
VDWLRTLDKSLFIFINRDLANPVFDFLFPTLTDLHQTVGFQVVAIPLLLYALFKTYKKMGIVILVGLLSSLAVTDFCGGIAKKYWERPRPFTHLDLNVIQRSGVGSFSFPSNHAGNMFCFACFMALFFPRQRWFFLILALIIAFTRVYNGVHYPSDVVAGALLGGFIGWLFGRMILRIIKTYKSKRPSIRRQSSQGK